jgi:uncharacterized protein
MWFVAACLLPAVAMAQSFDCGKAQGAVDRAVCASSRLRQLDSELGAAYAAALTRDPAGATTIRQAQRSWASGRQACFTSKGAANPEQCLTASYANRLAMVTGKAQPVAEPDVPRPISMPAQPPLQQQAQAAAAAFAEPRPATGLPASPMAAATLEQDRFATAGETDILLHVTTPGRFSIRATSPTGTAAQLVDMLTGPGERQGWPGKQDGRIDALLDSGIYKLRAFGDPAATGETTLSLTPFAEAGPAQLAPGYQPVATTLHDLQSQSFWLAVPEGSSPIRIEAAGRSLAALVLWRDGRDLVEVPATTSVLASMPSHPMTDIVLTGPVPPGSYLVTAYGGPQRPWADGRTEEPLYLRTGRSTGLLAGGLSDSVGVFGTEVFDLPPDAARALLVLPQPADTTLRAEATGADTTSLDTAKTDRARAALPDLPKRDAKDRSVTLQAPQGQAFTLRPLAAGQTIARLGVNAVSMPKPGRYWFGIEQPGAGGDEAPAAAILLRFHLDSAGTPDGAPQVLASPGVPNVGPGAAWRTHFNLRGETVLLFHADAAVTVAARTQGPLVTARVTTPEGAVMNAMGGGAVATAWSLSPGWYSLVLTPKPGAAGILDLTLGPPGITPPPSELAGPDAPLLSFGEQTVDAQSRLAVLTNRVPDTPPTLLTRALPVEIADFPLVQTLPAGPASLIDVHVRVAGILTVRDLAGGTALADRIIEAGSTSMVALPAADHARTLAIALLPLPRATAPEPAPAPALTPLQAGETTFLSLKRDGQADFALNVGQGGLYQVQTTGRLKTAGRIGTAFIPALDQADANGVGGNMLLQRYLRAGRYRLDVTVHDSAGRLGVTAAAAALSEGAELLPGGSVRTTLTPGNGVAIPIRVATTGRYHFDLLGDGRQFTVRLEDADGWPLRAAEPLTVIDQDLTPGRYRLIVQPQSVEARFVARLRKIDIPVALTGHGPHALPFDAAQSLEWREPAGRADPRAPDLWTFGLAGPAKVTLTITGDGMAAALIPDSTPALQPLVRLIAGTPVTVDLPAGQYQVAASSLGRNDHLAYTIALHSDALQPDAPLETTLPAELTFAIAEPRVVALTSFGALPLRAELRDAAGTVLTRAAGRADDWNIAVSRRLPAGRYRLTLSALAPAKAATADSDTSDATTGEDQNADSNGMASDTPDDQTQADQTDNQPDTSQDQANGDQSDQPAPQKPTPRTEITLFLPPDLPEQALPATGGMELASAGVQHVTLPAAPADSLLIAAAEAPVEIILALDHRGSDGTWTTVGQSQGLAPIVAIPVADADATWRASVWTVDGGTVPIHLAARAVTATPAPIGTVSLAPVPLSGITRHWYTAAVADPGSLALRLDAPEAALLAAASLGQPAEPPPNGLIAAQSDRVWLLSSQAEAPRLAVVQASADTMLPLPVPAGGHVILPSVPGTCAYVAESGLGQPGLDAGHGMGTAPASAFALCGGATISTWNAGGQAALRLRLRRIALTQQSDASADQVFTFLLPPHAAFPLHLQAGPKRIDVSLAAGSALVAGTLAAETITVWTGDTALSRSLTGTWTSAVLVNTADTPAPAALTVTPETTPLTLAPGQVFRRFFGAGGSFVLPLDAQPNQHLVVAGTATASVQRPSGQVREGIAIPLDGPAQAVVTHGSGALALWIEGSGASPWPAAAPVDVSLPNHLTLHDDALSLRLSLGTPILLRLSTTAPVILALGDDPPVLFGKGAALARYLPPGPTRLRLLSPQNGPLSGTLDLSGTPAIPVEEGLGAPVAIAPGGAAAFSFTVTAAGPVGLGVRADPDRIAVRLLDEHGKVLQSGVSMLQTLTPGRYLLEASVPPDAPTTLVRPAVLGIVPHPNPPPPEVIRGLMLAAGFTPPDNAR